MTNAKEVIENLKFKIEWEGKQEVEDVMQSLINEAWKKQKPALIQTIIHLYEEELKEIGEDEEFKIQADGEYHFLENQNTIAINEFKDRLRQSIQSKIDAYKELLGNK